MEEGDASCNMRYAAMHGAMTPTPTYSDGCTPEEGFSDDAATAWLGRRYGVCAVRRGCCM